MNHFTTSALLASIFSFAVCVYSIKGIGFGKRVSRVFTIYWFSIAFWSFFVGLQKQLLPILGEKLWGWFLHLGCLFIPTLFFHFALEATQRVPRLRAALKVAYGLTFVYLLLNSFTGVFTNGTAHRGAYAYPIPALLYLVYFVSFVIYLVWGTVLMVKLLPSVPLESRGPIGVFLASHALGYLGGMDNFAIMWDIRIFPLYPFGLYTVPLYALASIYALKRNLFPTKTAAQLASALSPSLG